VVKSEDPDHSSPETGTIDVNDSCDALLTFLCFRLLKNWPLVVNKANEKGVDIDIRKRFRIGEVMQYTSV
jgi:hypothetical protein